MKKAIRERMIAMRRKVTPAERTDYSHRICQILGSKVEGRRSKVEGQESKVEGQESKIFDSQLITHHSSLTTLHSPLTTSDSQLSTLNSQLSTTIAVYLATDDEISLDEFIASVPSGIRLAAPRWNAVGKIYELAEISGKCESLVYGHWGIREPTEGAPVIAPGEVDIWLVPGLAFTRSGKRLGYGGGYYDRFLAEAAPTAKSIAIAYPFQIIDDIPSSPHDIAVDEVLTA